MRTWLLPALLAMLGGLGPAVAGDAVTPGLAGASDVSLASLTGQPGQPARGRDIVLDRRVGNCLICHRVPVPEEPFQGELGPDLAGVGRRLSTAEIRARLVDAARLNPGTIMPPYHRLGGVRRVAPTFADKTVLGAQEIEDVVAWLALLK